MRNVAEWLFGTVLALLMNGDEWKRYAAQGVGMVWPVCG